MLGGFATKDGIRLGLLRLGGNRGRDAAAHEATHLLQEITEGALTKEAGEGLSVAEIGRYESQAYSIGIEVGYGEKSNGEWYGAVARFVHKIKGNK